MKLPRRLFVLSLLLFPAGSALADTAHRPLHGRPAPSLPSRADTHVYLIRGLFGVFSLGLDGLMKELVAQGYQSEIYGWDEAQKVIDLITQRAAGGHTGPVVLIGHSLGANAVISVATSIQQQNIPVDLGVTFDATDPGQVPSNVAVFINFWAQDGFGVPVSAVPGYAGDLENVDLSDQPGIDHTTIDAMEPFHQEVITRLESMTGK